MVWQVWLVLGLGLLATAWLLPVNVKSLNTALLREAGRDTSTVARFGRELLELDKPGPAALVLEAALPGIAAAVPRLTHGSRVRM